MKSFRLALAAFFLASLGVISIAVTQEISLVQVGQDARGQREVELNSTSR